VSALSDIAAGCSRPSPCCSAAAPASFTQHLSQTFRLKDGENGWEVARRAREIEPRLAVVYATSAFPEDWRAQGVPNSILLEKPFAVAQLLTAVSQLLNTGDGAA